MALTKSRDSDKQITLKLNDEGNADVFVGGKKVGVMKVRGPR